MPTLILRPVATVWTRLLSFVLSLTVLLLAVAPVVATSISTDLWVYQQGDTVNVTGDGFDASENVELVTTDPYGVEVDRGTVLSDGTGNIAYSFVLNSDVPGIYDIVATGLSSGLSASTQFDPAVWAIAADAPAGVQYSDTASFSGQLTCTRSGRSTPQCPTTTAGLAGDTVEVLVRFNPAGPLPIDYYLVASTTITAADCTVNSTTADNGLKGTCTWAATWQAGQLTVSASTYAVPADNYDLRVRAFGGATGNAAGSNSTRDDSRSLTIDAADTTTQAAHTGDTSLGNTITVDWIVSSSIGITGNTATGNVALVTTAAPPAGSLNCVQATQPVSEAQATGIGPEPTGFFESSGPIGEMFSCTPNKAGTYAFYAEFTDVDGDYNGSQSGPLTLVISGGNTAPTANTDSPTVNEDSVNSVINVLGNDTDPENNTLSVTVVGSAANGATSLISAVVRYTPTADYCGSDSFTYDISDGNGGTDQGTVNVTVSCVNDAPSFSKGANQTVLEDAGAQSVSGWATAISAGPADEASQLLTFNVSNDNNGLFSVQPAIAADGTLTYTPAANANGSTLVTVSLSDD
ncbi:MAG: Ig-like domain-containing protein, partial [Candidatus Limnocylindria bacterium]